MLLALEVTCAKETEVVKKTDLFDWEIHASKVESVQERKEKLNNYMTDKIYASKP